MEIKVTELSEKQIRELAKEIAAEISVMHDAKKRQRHDDAFHNTKLLLKNFNLLNKHCELVSDEISKEVTSFWFDWRFDLDSLLENKAKTVKLMNHVKACLGAYKNESKENFTLLEQKYLLPRPFSDEFIASRYDVDRRTIRRRIDTCVEELSVLLYGVDMILS